MVLAEHIVCLETSANTPELEYNGAMQAIQSLLKQAHEAFQARHWPEAIQALESLLPTVSQLSEAGTVFSQLSSFLNALDRENLRWSLSPRLRVHVMLAQAYWHNQQQDAALALLGDLLERNPTAELYQLLGRWYFESQHWDRAVRALGQALIHNPAYLPAYEDLLTIANLNGDSNLAHKMARQALDYGLSPRMIEELLLACSQSDTLPLKKIFIELCVRHVNARTRPMLVQLLQQLYHEGDYLNTEYLGFHLLQARLVEAPVLNTYVLAALHQAHYAQALQALLEAPSKFKREAGYWFKLATVYSHWQMPGFARCAYTKALQYKPEHKLRTQCEQALKTLGQTPKAETLFGEVLRQQAVSPSFREALRQNPVATLKHWEIDLPEELIAQLPGSASVS